jgi:hypothetical protein
MERKGRVEGEVWRARRRLGEEGEGEEGAVAVAAGREGEEGLGLGWPGGGLVYIGEGILGRRCRWADG